MKNKHLISFSIAFFGLLIFIVACKKSSTIAPAPPPAAAPSASFVEEFDNAGTLTSKGWVFRNNSFPVGQNGWRQGRYEAATGTQNKFGAPVAFYGFPAYSASTSPNDFISCDVTAGNDAGGTAAISAWLISPQLPMKNGDQIIFYSRAIDDANYSVYLKDRMQVRANFTDGTATTGGSTVDTGSFKIALLDINKAYGTNDPGGNGGITGYPRVWTKYTITLAGLPTAGIANGRFAFRYISTDAGLFGGLTGNNTPSVVGVDSLAFIHN